MRPARYYTRMPAGGGMIVEEMGAYISGSWNGWAISLDLITGKLK